MREKKGLSDGECTLLALLTLSALMMCVETISRNEFPSKPGFVFGSGSSAYQYEGSTIQDGRTPSIWDTFAHDGYMNGATGDIANDGYHKYKQDVRLMKETGLEAYRFSISWSRLIPDGRGSVNPKGLEYYNNVINELIRNGIEPHVTLLHFDVPQALEDKYEGFLCREIVKDFTAYADMCFREFGDRVLHWTTINEANIFVYGGYSTGECPPRRCSSFIANCSKGNSSTEPYLAAHHILLAHASAARLYHKKYKNRQHGMVGINMYSFGFYPYTNATDDVVATRRAQDFFLGWFMDPLVFGDYPEIMKKNVGSRLPAFTKLESEVVKGSLDFIGINFYQVIGVQNAPNKSSSDRGYNSDMEVWWIVYDSDNQGYELPIVPWGLLGVLDHLKQVYRNPPAYVHENGQQTKRNGTLNDIPRVEYLRVYIASLLDALRNGTNLKGYFYWSFLDSVELLTGYETSYGLCYVDLDKDLKRYPKLSARWYSNFLKMKNLNLTDDVKIEPITQNSFESHFSHK